MSGAHALVGHLSHQELLGALDRAGREIADRDQRQPMVDCLAAEPALLQDFLSTLKRDRLKQLCRKLNLDDRGRAKAPLLERLLNVATSEEPGLDSTTQPAPATKPKTQRTDHAELLRQLWEAAVKLRGPIETPDYKRFVLPLIFLRFLSARYEQRRQNLANEVREPSSPKYAETEREAAFILNDEDSYRQANVFPVPEVARWEYLRRNAQADDIKIMLDKALEVLEMAYPHSLKGLLPRIFAGSNLPRESVTGLINLFSKEVFTADHGGSDILGQVYEYFIGGFASSEGKRGGEYFTPVSIVRTLVEMLEPTEGIVYDPCCGSGGMFVQSDAFTQSRGLLSFYGQEQKEFTYRLCRMNLFIHGLDGDIHMGNTYVEQPGPVRADYVLANPPFNAGSKSEEGWGADKVADKDPRLKLGKGWMPLSARNANTMWMLHFLHHLEDGGTAGFVMATGELSNSEVARRKVRQALIEGGYVDCIVQLTGQLFANTQIPCSLWFLSKNRGGTHGYRERKDEILFIDGRKLGSLIPGSRTQKALTAEEIERMASIYREFKRERSPENIPGFCAVATVGDVKGHQWALTPGRFVGAGGLNGESEPFEEQFPLLLKRLRRQFTKSRELEARITDALKVVADVP